MIDGISDGKPYAQHVKEDAKAARDAAMDLVSWIKSRMFKRGKDGSLKNFPFIVAMAFSARVEMDSYIIESEMIRSGKERETFMNRIRRPAEELAKIVFGQLCDLVNSSSLLEIAFDLHVYVATYVTLLKSFRASLSLLPPLSNPEMPFDIYDWNDGLSPLR